MSSNIEYLNYLHRDDVITNDDLKKGIRALKLPDEPSPKAAELKELALEKSKQKVQRQEKKRPKQRRAEASEEATAKASEETQSEENTDASQFLKLMDRPLCNYLKHMKLMHTYI